MMVLCNLDFLRLGRGTKRKVMGTTVFGNLYRLYITIHEGSALTEDQRGTGLLCFSAFFFSLRHLHFFASLDKEDLNPHICDFCLARRLGEDKGGFVCWGEQRLPLFLSSYRKCSASPLFFFYSFLSFFHHPLIFAFVLFFSLFPLFSAHLYNLSSKTAEKGRLEI